MADESDKSVVVWWPNTNRGVPDRAEWGSLCLWHDIILCGFSDAWPTRTTAETAFSNALSELREQKIIRPVVDATDAGCVSRMRSPEWLVKWYRQECHEYGLTSHRGGAAVMTFISVCASIYNKCPLVTNEPILPRRHKLADSTEHLSAVLSKMAISQLALPEVRPVHVHDLLEARSALRDELLEFRAGIRKLTWLLHQQVKGENDLNEIRREADVLVRTVIEGAVMSLENRMRDYDGKRWRRMLFSKARVLVKAAKMFVPGTLQEKLIALGKTTLGLATEKDSAKPPEDQIATYLYKLKRHLKS